MGPPEGDVDKYGEPLRYDKSFKGPLSRRSCTDVICLIIFVVFLCGWSYIAFYAIRNGDLEKLLVPVDSQGLRCGVDSKVTNKPYLFFFNLEKCIDPLVTIKGCPTPQVCVEKCPDEMFVFNTYESQGNFQKVKEMLICTTDEEKKQITSMALAKRAIEENRCARWYLKSKPVSHRCMPNNFENINEVLKAVGMQIDQFLQAISKANIISEFSGLGQQVVEDITDSWALILVAYIIAMFVCLLFIAIMRWLAAPMVWFSIVGVLGLLIYGVYVSVTKHIYYRDQPVPTGTSPNLQSLVESWFKEKHTWLYLSIILSVIFLIIFLMVIFLRKRIVIAIALIKEGSKAVSTIISSIFFPIFPWILQIGTIAFAIAVGLYLASVGKPTYKIFGMDNTCQCSGPASSYQNEDSCDPVIFNDNCRAVGASFFQRSISTCTQAGCYFVKIDSPKLVGYFHAVNVIGFFWLLFFISAFGEMVLAATFATWYWTFHKKDVPFFTLTKAFTRTIRYHLGTLAFGSLIVTICRLIRLMLEYLEEKLKLYDNPCTRAVMCCMKCFFWCLEKFLRFLNKNAYIMCAIHGKNFCISAKDAFNLLMRNFLRVITLDKVTDFLFFLSKLVISLLVGAATYFYAETMTIHYSAVPTVIVVLGTYLIASVFFGVYSMAVDTLFLCFLEDCERNDGSAEKPYYMSKNLMKILGKRNKIPKHQYR